MPEAASLPLFPLHTVLVPGAALELRIFERRYLDMVANPEVLDTFKRRVQVVSVMREWLAARGLNLSDFRESWFYSDSNNDLPLLSHVTHPVAVNADAVLAAHARYKGWPEIHVR